MSTFLPYPHVAKIVEVKGLHCAFIILPLYPLIVGLCMVDNDLVRFLKSHTEAVSSAEPLNNKNSLNGEKSKE